MSTNAQDGSRPTVVLVHGAFADASSWNGVVERLQTQGVQVTAPANPLRGMSIDSGYINSLLDQTPGPVLAVEGDELRRPLTRFFEDLERRLRETLREAVEAGELPKGTDVGDLAALLVAAVQGGYVASRVLDDPGKLEDATRAARALLINATGPKNG